MKRKKMMAEMRINKYISDSGVTSRRKAEEFVLQGRVSVNGKVIKKLSTKVDPGKDDVRLDGEEISIKRNIYYLLNKPKGYISSTDDEKNRETVIDLINTDEKIYPVGRLDYNTTGVLILTNDGDFKQLLTHPRNKVPRVYEVKIDNTLKEEDKERLQKGIDLFGQKGRFLKIKNLKNFRELEVVCEEGRNHFVKNMFGNLGYNVKELNRKSFAGIEAKIPVGSYRKLSEKELKEITKKYGRIS